MIKQQKLKCIKQHYESSLSTNPTPARRTSLSLKITEAGTDKSDGGKAEDADDEPDRGAARARAPWARPRPRPRPPGLGSDRRLCREEFRRLTGLEITSSDCGGRGGNERRPRTTGENSRGRNYFERIPTSLCDRKWKERHTRSADGRDA